jgi:hypothetical protein
MQIKPAALGLILIIAGSAAASAQTSLSASLPRLGGVGVGPHGTGFNGTMGDPDYYLSGSSVPESEGHYPGPYGTMGALRPVTGGVPYEVAPPTAGTPPAIQYQFGPPPRR